MARMTARQAAQRTRTRREPRGRSLRQISNVGVVSGINNLSLPVVDYERNNELIPSVKPIIQRRVPKARQILTNNTKITDFFPVLTRGRDNVKSPQIAPRIGSQRSPSNYIGRNDISDVPAATVCLPEVRTGESSITNFINSSDANSNYSASRIPLTTGPSVKRNLYESEVPKEPCDSFKLLNCSTYDEDIEVVTILPPISLRDHPVVDLNE